MEQVSQFKGKPNLFILQDYDGDLWVQSYNTIVARIDSETNELVELGKWSATTTRHCKFVAQQMNLKYVPATNKETY